MNDSLIERMKSGKYMAMMILAILIFSTFEVVTKTMNGALTGALLTFYRFLIGGLFLLPFALKDMKRRGVQLSGKDLALLAAFGFTLVTVSMTLAQIGIFFASASISAVIFSSNPLFISLFAALFLKERLSSPKMIGLAVGIVGLFTTCANLVFTRAGSPTFVQGVLLTILSMVIFCIYTVLNKKWIVPKFGPTAATALTALIGSFTLLPLVVQQGLAKGVNPFAFPIMSVLPQFLYCSLIGTGLAYLCYFTALANLDTSTGSMAFLAKPPLASIFAAVFLHEVITGNVIVGIVLIIAGLFIAVRMKPAKAATA